MSDELRDAISKVISAANGDIPVGKWLALPPSFRAAFNEMVTEWGNASAHPAPSSERGLVDAAEVAEKFLGQSQFNARVAPVYRQLHNALVDYRAQTAAGDGAGERKAQLEVSHILKIAKLQLENARDPRTDSVSTQIYQNAALENVINAVSALAERGQA